jgi:hypothetical protein
MEEFTVVRTVSWIARHALIFEINCPRPWEVSPLRRMMVGGVCWLNDIFSCVELRRPSLAQSWKLCENSAMRVADVITLASI